jgi:hypothetical protein
MSKYSTTGNFAVERCIQLVSAVGYRKKAIFAIVKLESMTFCP